MKPSFTQSVPLALVAAGVSGLLSSCVVTEPAVTEPPTTTRTVTTYQTGYMTPTLPTGYRSEQIDGTEYYTYNGNYYRPRGNGYVVVEAPRMRPVVGGEVRIATLPSGYHVLTRGGVRYYRVNDTYYRQQGDAYVIVRNPL